MQSLDVNGLDTIMGIPLKAPSGNLRHHSSLSELLQSPPATQPLIPSSHHGRHSQPAPGWSLRWPVNSCTGEYCSWCAHMCLWCTAGVAHRLHDCSLMATDTPIPVCAGQGWTLPAAGHPTTGHWRRCAGQHGGCTPCAWHSGGSLHVSPAGRRQDCDSADPGLPCLCAQPTVMPSSTSHTAASTV